MSGHVFFTLDVFAEKKFAGNQLAVFMPGAEISDSDMQLIAREMNYSETTFILADRPANGGYPVRIFTPAEEVPFAGHPTLGTAFVIQQKILNKPVEKLVLNLSAGQIPVTFNYENGRIRQLFMQQLRPEFGRTFTVERIAEILSIDPGDIDPRFPVQEVSTGLPFIICPLKNREAIKRSHIQRTQFFDLIRDSPAKAIMVFCPQPYEKENHLNARVYVDYYGIPEDPATGSANGCLAGYLVRYRYFGEDRLDIRVEQGYEIGRPSLLYLQAAQTPAGIDIRVGGKVILISEAILY